MEKNNDKLINAIITLSFKDGNKIKLTCDSALKIAEQFRVKPLVVGNICNNKNIRLCQCQLGCFK